MQPPALPALVCFLVFLLSTRVLASDPLAPLSLEAHVLLQFKQAITKDPLGALHSWTNASNESSTASPLPLHCHWFGITCDTQQSLVTSIALSGFKLEGSITPLIVGITSLVSVDLSMNALSGHVPSSLGMLPNLQRLKLASNKFVGGIPVSLCNCSSLVLLDVSDNMISDGIPAQLGALPSLKGLFLSHNLLEGTLPSAISNASTLQFLDVSRNNITGSLPNSIGYLKSLLLLKLASNHLTGSIPPEIFKLISLQGLDLSNNRLSGELPLQMAGCPFLAVVILSNNMLAGGIPIQMGDMRNLRVLHLNNNLLSGAVHSSLGICKWMEDLVLSHNLLNGSIPSTVASLSNLLLSFAMSNNLLTGSIPLQIGGMSQVQKIDLSQNMLSGNIPQELGNCSGLESLDLSNNQLTGFIPESLNSLLSLTYVLNLSQNLLEGAIPAFQNLTYLTSIDLSHNKLNSSIPRELLTLRHLTYIGLSFNRLGGCFPQVNSAVSRHMTSTWIEGNHDLCVPTLCGFCQSGGCSSGNSSQLSWYIWSLLSIAFLVWLGTVIYFCSSEWCAETSLGPYIPRKYLYSGEDLLIPIQGINPDLLIGRGASSDVYKVEFENGHVYALKCFKPTARPELFYAELRTLIDLRHRNLVRVRGFCNQGTTRAILLDYMEKGSLKKQLHDMAMCDLDLERRIQVLRDVAEGLVYLHYSFPEPIIHGDLKPGNILLDTDYKAHVADFGLARFVMDLKNNAVRQRFSTTRLRLIGTVGYMAPEYGAFRITPSVAGDVYSFGVIVLELLTRKQPGEGDFPPGIYSLPDFVSAALTNNNLDSVLDPELKGQMRTTRDHRKVSLLASIGVDCASTNPASRPSMTRVASSLQYHPTFRGQTAETNNTHDLTW